MSDDERMSAVSGGVWKLAQGSASMKSRCWRDSLREPWIQGLKTAKRPRIASVILVRMTVWCSKLATHPEVVLASGHPHLAWIHRRFWDKGLK